MIDKFIKVTNDLFRGGAPSPKDVAFLKKNYGINKIVSLDEESGNRIKRACKLLNINHIMLPLNGTKKSLANLLNKDLEKLFLKDGPTFVHCHYGKDRTGLIIALVQCKYLGVSAEKALKEAKKLGFGIGVDPKVVKLYEKLIRSCKSKKDKNEADIVSNQREYKSDNRDSYLDEAQRSSFSPYLSHTQQYPYDNVYLEINDQSPTRQNYQSIIEYDNKEQDVPMVGIYNNNAGIMGAGPAENVGGFIYD